MEKYANSRRGHLLGQTSAEDGDGKDEAIPTFHPAEPRSRASRNPPPEYLI